MKEMPKQIQTLLMDDIREEKNGKLTLVGIYSDEIIVERLPATLAKLCFFTRANGGNGEFKVRISLKDPIGTELLTIGGNEGVLDLKGKTSNIVHAVAPFNMQAGEYVYRVFFDETETCVYSFNIKIGEVK